MIQKIALTNIVFLFLGYMLYAQEIPKDTIYLEFVKNDGSFPKYEGIKFRDDRKILNFNLINGPTLYMPKKSSPDTLCYKHLKDYKITDTKKIDSLNKNWFVKNKNLLKEIKGKIPPPLSINDRFTAYLIEKHPDYFIIYPVYWKKGIVGGLTVGP